MIAPVVALAALGLANAWSNDTAVNVTEVVTAYTTYCPESTTLTFNNKTYTITEATTLTITDCPCTITHSSAPTVAPNATQAPTSVVPGNGAVAKGLSAAAGVAAAAAYFL